MATFIVKTINDRNLVLKADKFVYLPNPNVYEFSNGERLVAHVQGRDVLAVTEEETWEADFYDHFHADDLFGSDPKEVPSE